MAPIARSTTPLTRHLLPAVLAAALLVSLAAAAAAHHSISGQYDLEARATLRGVIARVDWINPHAYVYLDVTEADGSTTRWALATVPLAMMRKAGLTKEAIAGTPGEVVTIDVMPGLGGKRQGWIVKITYRGGRFYQLSGR